MEGDVTGWVKFGMQGQFPHWFTAAGMLLGATNPIEDDYEDDDSGRPAKKARARPDLAQRRVCPDCNQHYGAGGESQHFRSRKCIAQRLAGGKR